MTLVLSGDSLTIEDVVRVARRRARAAGPGGRAWRGARGRGAHAGGRGGGVRRHTGVGVLKSFRVADDGHDALLLRQHLIAQGPPLPRDVVRAAAARLVNAFAQGSPAHGPSSPSASWRRSTTTTCPPSARSALSGRPTSRRRPTSPSASSATRRPPLARHRPPEPERVLGWPRGARGSPRCAGLLDSLDVAGALDLEALGANRESLLHPALASARPSPGLQVTLDRLRALVAGSEVSARSLQDPLSFRTLPQLHGAARDALDYVAEQVEQAERAPSNPLVVVDEERLDVGRELRDRGPRDRPRSRPPGARAGAHERGRAPAQAPPGAVHGAARGRGGPASPSA